MAIRYGGYHGTAFSNTKIEKSAQTISVKLSDFWKNDPVAWFAQAEAQFALAGVTQDATKFHHIVANIDQSVMCHVKYMVTDQASYQYKWLKERLISIFQEVTAKERIERWLSSCNLADMRPTQMLAKMRELTHGLCVTDEFLKTMFISGMPPNVRSVLNLSDGSIGRIAAMADKMLESSWPAAATSPMPAGKNDIEESRRQIAALITEVRDIKSNKNRDQEGSSTVHNISLPPELGSAKFSPFVSKLVSDVIDRIPPGTDVSRIGKVSVNSETAELSIQVSPPSAPTERPVFSMRTRVVRFPSKHSTDTDDITLYPYMMKDISICYDDPVALIRAHFYSNGRHEYAEKKWDLDKAYFV